jgi:tRNA threonylcarbamoyladenosine biosynthesis protein TsaE
MRELGRSIAAVLRAGDLVVLSGDLGAGKTTLTQGVGAGLGVRHDVTSPTFVIARVHPPAGDGPALVHVDAYRLSSLAEVDDLDLDASLADSVTVVEWGEGLVEALADDRLEIRLRRPRGDEDGGADVAPFDGDEPRTVEVTGFGARWRGVDLPGAGPRGG